MWTFYALQLRIAALNDSESSEDDEEGENPLVAPQKSTTKEAQVNKYTPQQTWWSVPQHNKAGCVRIYICPDILNVMFIF